jgi:hypothetical protein
MSWFAVKLMDQKSRVTSCAYSLADANRRGQLIFNNNLKAELSFFVTSCVSSVAALSLSRIAASGDGGS